MSRDLRYIIVAVIVGFEVAFGVGFAWPYQAGLAVLFLVLGLPHGAFDVWLYERAVPGRSRRAFLIVYVGLVAAMMGLWWLSPPAALLGFSILSVHHFGESDMPEGSGALARWSRGLFVVGTPLVSHVGEIAPILTALDIPTIDGSPAWIRVATAGLVLQHAGALIRLHGRSDGGTLGAALCELAFWSIAFWVLPPLLSFGLYFTLWHAIAHVADLRRRFGADGELVRWRHWAPYAAAPTAVLAWSLYRFAGELSVGTVAATTLLVTSALTLPHVLLVSMARRRFGVPTETRC